MTSRKSTPKLAAKASSGQKTRTEYDSFGSIEVASDALWGAQTQRSMSFFAISDERMPKAFIAALAGIKRACAQVNHDLGLLPENHATAIAQAADEVINGLHDSAFPLSIWQTGSGTQTNMNMNEVLAHLANTRFMTATEATPPIHPNDTVNLGQSTNDIFPTAIHLAGALGIHQQLLPALVDLRRSLAVHAHGFEQIIKIGRTHLQDATPLTLGQEFSGYVTMLEQAENLIKYTLTGLFSLAIGGTAVGTGLNTHPEFGQRVAAQLATIYGLPFTSADNKFAALAAHDAVVAIHGALKSLAVSLNKIANDIRWLASGPRCGLGELRLPENEPGSSMMPGKVNPTQCEAITMLCYQVMGNDVVISLGGASGNFELNVFKPLLAHNLLQSIRLLSDGMRSFDLHCIRGIEARHAKIAEHLEQSLMLVTALVPHIGYDRAAKIARRAQLEGTTLREAALANEDINPDDLERWLQPDAMLGPSKK